MANEVAASTAVSASPTEASSSEISEQNDFGLGGSTPIETAQAPAAPELTKAEIKYLNKLKLKVDGQDYDEELPFELPDDPEVIAYMTKQLQMSKMAQKRAQSYSDLEKNVNTFIEELQKNPRKTLSDPRFGIDLKKIAAEMIEEEINNSKKSPEQLKTEQLEAELKELKEGRDKEKKTSEEREFERLQQQEAERYDVSMSRALEKSDLPKSPYVVKKMADYMLLGLQNGIDVTPEEVLPLVREEIMEDIKSMFAVMPAEVVESIIGKDTIGKIRKKQVESAKKAAAAGPRSIADSGKSGTKVVTGKEKSTFKQFFGV
jgi:hypothetical protein